MDSLQLAPYIFFKGNCKEAMEFYHKVLGGQLKLITYGETGGDTTSTQGKEKISYAELVSNKMVLKAMDSDIANPEARKVEIMISGTRAEEMLLRKIFDGLAEGGKVKHAMEKHPRGNTQGRLYDAYGLDWIVSIEI